MGGVRGRGRRPPGRLLLQPLGGGAFPISPPGVERSLNRTILEFVHRRRPPRAGAGASPFAALPGFLPAALFALGLPAASAASPAPPTGWFAASAPAGEGERWGERWYEPASGLTMASFGRPGAPAAGPVQGMGGTPPSLHFSASGTYSFSSARVTVDARVAEGSELTVRLTDPSGGTETLSMEPGGSGAIRRHTWVGQLTEAGQYRVEATLEGPNQDRWTDSETLTLDAGEPSCAVSVSVPEGPTEWWLTEITANVCESSAATGDLATAYVVVERDGVRIASMDMSDACERAFFIPEGGDYVASAEIHDDRGVSATCSSSDVGVDERYPRAWLTLDLAGGALRSSREDIVDAPATAALGGGGLGLTVPFRSGPGGSLAFSARVAGGRAHRNWLGAAADAALTYQGRAGFLGFGGGLWGIGDPELVDVGVFGTGGINLPGGPLAGPTQLFVEGRLFAKHFDDWRNNYSVLGGLRFNFKPHHRLRRR